MNLLLALALAVSPAHAAASHSAPAPAQAAAKADIVRLEQQWGDAFVRHDHALLERLVAPEFRLVVAQADGRSSVVPRAAWMKNANAFRWERFEAQTVDVNVVGDTAVASVQIFNLLAERPGDTAKPNRAFVTDTLIRRHGQWQVIHRYSHRLPGAAWPAPGASSAPAK